MSHMGFQMESYCLFSIKYRIDFSVPVLYTCEQPFFGASCEGLNLVEFCIFSLRRY